MKNRLDKYVAFDVETLGLTADSRIVSYCLLDVDETTSMCGCLEERELLDQLSCDVDEALSGKILVTFNGENWSGGFDIPLLRTRYVINDMIDAYPFSGVKHVDLMPIFQKKFNTSFLKDPTLDDLNAAQCKQLVGICDCKPRSTKALNIELLMDVDERYQGRIASYLDNNLECRIVNKFGLKHCHKMFFGGEIGTTGADVAEMWESQQYDRIKEYNRLDCEMTLELLEICLKIVSDYDMRYFVL